MKQILWDICAVVGIISMSVSIAFGILAMLLSNHWDRRD